MKFFKEIKYKSTVINLKNNSQINVFVFQLKDRYHLLGATAHPTTAKCARTT